VVGGEIALDWRAACACVRVCMRVRGHTRTQRSDVHGWNVHIL
jgi:hypothetical protein